MKVSRQLCILLVFITLLSVAESRPDKGKGKKNKEHKKLWDDWTEWWKDIDDSEDSDDSGNLVSKSKGKHKEEHKDKISQKYVEAKSKKSQPKIPISKEKYPVGKYNGKKDYTAKQSGSDKKKSALSHLDKWSVVPKPRYKKYSDDISSEEDYKEIDDEIAGENPHKLAEIEATPNRVHKLELAKKKHASNHYGYGIDMAYSSKGKLVEQKQRKVSVEKVSAGIQFDSFPGKADRTHSVKKDLQNPAYLKDYAKTKPDPKTSPNPPPPGLGDGKPLMVTPSGKKVGKDIVKKRTYIESKPLKTCKGDEDCRIGRMCHSGICVCLEDDGCQGHTKPVCGSDKLWYPSHCELHRMACVRREHIRIDHKGLCFRTEDKPAEVKSDKVKKQSKKAPPLVDPDSMLPKEAFETAVVNSAAIYDFAKGNSSPKGQKLTGKKKDIFQSQPLTKKEKDEAEAKYLAKMKKSSAGVGMKELKKPVEEKKKECTREEYEKFKVLLLQFHCKRFAEPDCRTELQEEREYLATLMFSVYDIDLDYYMESKEAEDMEEKEQYGRLSHSCVLKDMIVYDDRDPVDGKLSVSEFISAFSLNGSSKVSKLQKELQIIPTMATVGNGLELKCGIAGAEDIVWKRHGADIKNLPTGELTVFEDGSLFFSKVRVHHIGNYSCEDHVNPTVQQVHTLRVQMPPIVKVSPSSQLRQTHSDISIKCHVEGVPKPEIKWTVNEHTIPEIPQHFIKTHENGTLFVHDADYKRDTGAYKCIGHNQAGQASDVASVFIQNPNTTRKTYSYVENSYGIFLAFHDKGYTAYEPEGCLMERSVRGDFGNFKFIPDSIDGPLKMCDPNIGCNWGSSVNVKNQFVYVSQPKENRVVIIEVSFKLNPIQVIDTDKSPVELHYVEHLDQVWVLCWNGEDDGSMKTIVVIRDASKYIQHHAVHMQPVGNRFDLVEELFLPEKNDLQHAFNYGYITHNSQQGLFKLDMKTMKYVKAIDFSQHKCVPRSVAFVPIGGHVVIQCVVPRSHQTRQLVMDYVTDAIRFVKDMPGIPYASPDSRHVVTVDNFTGRVTISEVTSEGKLESSFEVTVSPTISDVTFFPSSIRKGYDLVLTSVDDNNIIFVNLGNGNVKRVVGTKEYHGKQNTWTPVPVKKTIIGGGVFGDFLLTPLRSSIRIIDGRHHKVQCDFTGPVNTRVMAFVQN